MKKYKKIIFFVFSIGTIATFAICTHQNEYKYVPNSYTIDEVRCLYQENTELFENVVTIISSNEVFFEKGRPHEDEDAFISSPYDQKMSFFDNASKSVIDELFVLKPYMILYDYVGRFVSITFIVNDYSDACSFLFWIYDGIDTTAKFKEYKNKKEQNYILEDISNHCFMYYHKRILR